MSDFNSSPFHTKNVACVIVTFHPGPFFFQLVEKLKAQQLQIIVVDNHSNQAIQTQILSTAGDYVQVLCNDENEGIAQALNRGIREAEKRGFEWAITFDQDSCPLTGLLDIYNNCYNDYPSPEKIGAIGLNFLNKENEVYKKVYSEKSYKVKDYLITSGCLTSIAAYNKAGGFDEALFIDNVDLDFSLKLTNAGYVSLLTAEPGMQHNVGDLIRKKILGFLDVSSSNHSPLRRYYMAKNHFVLTKRFFFSHLYFIAKMNYFFAGSLIGMLLVEKSKYRKFIASLNGMFDGVFGTNLFLKKFKSV